MSGMKETCLFCGQTIPGKAMTNGDIIELQTKFKQLLHQNTLLGKVIEPSPSILDKAYSDLDQKIYQHIKDMVFQRLAEMDMELDFSGGCFKAIFKPKAGESE